jgi:hypothetical protein
MAEVVISVALMVVLAIGAVVLVVTSLSFDPHHPTGLFAGRLAPTERQIKSS